MYISFMFYITYVQRDENRLKKSKQAAFIKH
jgi:hypothetical protein